MTKENTQREPFLRIARNPNPTVKTNVLARVVGVLFAFIVCFLVGGAVTGDDLGQMIVAMWKGTFSNRAVVENFFKNMMILLGIGLALAPAFKLRFWNIGAQGQVLIGSVCSALVLRYIGLPSKMPYFFLFLLMLIAALLGGAVWAVIPAIFKVKSGANETLFTLMMNYIAIQFVRFFQHVWCTSNSFPGFVGLEKEFFGAKEATYVSNFPKIFGAQFGWTYLIIPVLAIVLYFYMSKTKHGYEIAVVGESQSTAKYIGINTSKVTLRTVALSGLICGLCGFLFVYTNSNPTISTTADDNYGFTAIIVTWGAHFNPLYMALISFGIVFLEKGAGGIVNQHSEILNGYFPYIYVGIFLFCLIGCEFFVNYKMIFSDKLKDFFTKIWESVKGFFVKVWKKLKGLFCRKAEEPSNVENNTVEEKPTEGEEVNGK